MTPETAELSLRSVPDRDAALAFRQGIAVLQAGRAEILLPFARDWARHCAGDARLHQLRGLAARASCESGEALSAFARAAELAPTDPLIAHSHARAALEAGHPSTALFDRAARLAPQDGSVLLGKTAAELQDHGAMRASAFLRDVVRRNPLWIDGQRTLAHLLAQMGSDPVGEIDRALESHPADEGLHRLKIATLLEARLLEPAARARSQASDRLGRKRWLDQLEAHIASEGGRVAEADALFARCGAPAEVGEVSTHARHLLRAGRPAEACAILEPWIERDEDNLLFPYLSLAWRLVGDERWQWLEGDERLVGIYDLADKLGDLSAIADHVRSLHFASDAPLDQSVRGGTQTDGNILLRDDPFVAALRAAVLEAVERHIDALPPAQAGHPTLLRQRTPRRIAGSWSVRLRDAGFHADHVHSQGWFSSAFYLVCPETLSRDGGTAGWLSLGECRELVPDLDPVRLVEPKPGRLVLFPSTMWHGTHPFPAGERMTIAFDIARPRQD